ncbi:MAG: MmgE/PrpD family protein [Deltaproteobacteria bacterium]|nr:MmgE/PrpD family protein [Deltaproteobacteria bacterium]
MTIQRGVTEELSEWLCSVRYGDLPSQVRSKALDVVFDSVGGMIACSALPEVRCIVEFLLDAGGKPECTILGHKERTSAVNAAMANGAMAHASEVDPVHLSSSGGHVAAGCVPTALTLGEYVNATGKDLLLAVALGYEVGGRLITIFYRERDYLTRRFYHTAVAGAVSSAVTASLLLGLDRRSLQVAMGLAAYQAAGPDNMTKDPGHMGKTFQVAAANRNGVTAAFLARKGCFVPLDVLEGSCGLFDAFLGTSEVAPEMLKGLGEYYAITDVMHKRYPVGSPNQTYLQALFHLFCEHGIKAEDIQGIEIQMPTRSVRRIPTTRHASISGEVVCAMAAVYGKADFYQLHDPTAVTHPSVQKMRERIRFVGREDWKGMEHGRHAIVTLTAQGGRKFSQEVWFEPMTGREIEEKFKGLITPRFGEEKTRRLEMLLHDVENAASVKPLLEEL